jgi:hypothetical protein
VFVDLHTKCQHPLKVTPSLASEPEPPPLPGTPTTTLPWKRYASYGADQAERVVEGIGRLERQMVDFAHV